MPPIRHGRFTLNIERSVVRRDNTGRYDVVAIDEWENDVVIRTNEVAMTEPIDPSAVSALIAGINSGKRPPRFNL
jgi:hypothetical protein